jgi:hypothetical protein
MQRNNPSWGVVASRLDTRLIGALGMLVLGACTHQSADRDPIPPPSAPPPVRATFEIAQAALSSPTTFIVYGDMRFTAASETEASRPAARRALAARIAAEQPAALFLTGDVPWHGVDEDYAVFREETRDWRRQQVPVFPALGNHEFYGCDEPQCLARWWAAFPEIAGQRWYSVALGSRVRALVLDSDAPLTAASEQRTWLEEQLGDLDRRVQLVLLVMHHPPFADPVRGGSGADHRVRPNEAALAGYLEQVAGHLSARLVVVAGHIHNYERFEHGGVTYLVSGGGGAKPYEVERSPADLYRDATFPNFHYLRFELRARTLAVEMVRLEVAPDGATGAFDVKDRFEISLSP